MSEEALPPHLGVRIAFPPVEALVRANVPIFGVASVPEFDGFLLEFGEGRSPEKWIPIRNSKVPETKDPLKDGSVTWSQDWGTEGNLGNWETGLDEYPYGQTWKHNLRGLYTLRLTVKTKDGRTAQHAIQVIVGRVLTNWLGGYGESPDRVVRFSVGPDSLTRPFVLVSLLPFEKELLPLKGCARVSEVYEFQPPGLKLAKSAQLTFKIPKPKDAPKEVPAPDPGGLGNNTPGQTRESVEPSGEQPAQNGTPPASVPEARAPNPVLPSQYIIYAYDSVEEKWRPLPTALESSASRRIEPADVKDFCALCSAIAAQGASDAPSPGCRLWQLLPEDVRARVLEVARPKTEVAGPRETASKEPEPAPVRVPDETEQRLEPATPSLLQFTEPVRPGTGPGPDRVAFAAILAGLNGVLTRRDFYDGKAFAKVTLSPEAKALIDTGTDRLTESSVLALNRILFDAAFGDALASVSAAEFCASTRIRQVSPYLAYYALFADTTPPQPPVMDPIPAHTQRRLLKVAGRAEPDCTVIVEANETAHETPADSTGRFSCEVSVVPGENGLRILCRDPAGNLSQAVEHQVALDYRHPLNVRAITVSVTEAQQQDIPLVVRLSGENASPEVDITLVQVSSSQSDPKGFSMEVVETGPATGDFTGSCLIGRTTDTTACHIAANTHGESVRVCWVADPEVKAVVAYQDRIPPDAPTIELAEAHGLCWQTFESQPGQTDFQWKPLDTDLGGIARVVGDDKNRSIRVKPPGNGMGHLGIVAWDRTYPVRSFPMLSFDFRAMAGTEIDLLVELTSPALGWRGIGLTDRTPYFARLAVCPAVEPDGQWHHVEVNLLRVLDDRYGPGVSPLVSRIAFADWSGGDRLFGTKFLGSSASKGGTYDVDNFSIRRYSSGPDVTFRWSATDNSKIRGYSLLLDRNPDTVPAAEMTTHETWKSYEGLEDGRWWFHVCAVDEHGNWGPPNHYLHVVDTKPPEVQLRSPADDAVSPGVDMEIELRDTGAGVDPMSVKVQIDGREYRWGDPVLEFNRETSVLKIGLHRGAPWPLWFLDGSPIHVRTMRVMDLAGRVLTDAPSWKLKASSPVLAADADLTARNGWLKGEPDLRLGAEAAGQATLAWMRSLKGDRYAGKGCFIREVGVFDKQRETPAAPQIETASAAAESPPRFVVEVKVDKTMPSTEFRAVDLAPLEGLVGRQRITLEHSEFAYRRGGLIGRYYRKPDFSELIVERVDPFVYFFDDREQFTPAVYGAHSAVWSGGLYVAEAGKFDLELAAWQRAPARGKVAIDGKTIFELKPETMGAIGYVKGQVELADGLRDIRLEFSDPTDRSWSFALFVWRKGKRGEDLREVFCPKELYYVESVGTTHYRWDDTPFQVYAVPLVTPPGKHALHFYTKDMAGNVEKTQTREFAVGLMSERDR